ncbi:hypothetical protein TIFTF001_027625 [Ficus carica]|uniref:DUF4110 domain-containing protein n=1 Tax=Ficus carica TaxID=3494 RepID=A0AA88IVE2_FICCA|nr:hypothetical protein TIFTF001_027625 [Ficus carica]
MGKKTKKPGKGKEKTEKKTAKAEEKRARRETKKLSPEDDIDAILTFVYGDLYRYDIEKQEWKLISSPNSPPPRSAHQAVAWKNYLYVFGGEFTSPNQERFHHYKDFWVLDLKTNQWEQLNLKGCPSPRSGHRMVLYKHKLIIFGGFYDTLREVRYYNDLYVFDLDQFKWQEVKPGPGSLWPSARSGFQFFVYQDEIFLYGGYSKEIASDKSGSEKGNVHSDLWSLDPRTWEWNKVKKSGMPPGPRAGFSVCVHKRRAVLFGGVVDMEAEGDVMMSLFLNELYGFQFDSRRWYPLELRKEKSATKKLKKSSEQKGNGDDKSNSVEAEELATNEKDEKSQYDEEADDVESDIDQMSEHMTTSMIVDDDGPAANSNGKIPESSAKLDLPNSDLPEIVKPCGRINSCMVVGRDTLYIYGGLMEVKDQEVTLDDLYSLNLSKLDEWKCIIPGCKDGSVQLGDAVALIKGEGKKLRRKEKRARIEQIRASLGLSDSQRTPTPGESLRDFYKRTNLYWQMAAHEHTQHTGKELRKDGFDLAEARYRELKPILDELAVLEAEQKAEEAEAPETSSRKRGKKKNKH